LQRLDRFSHVILHLSTAKIPDRVRLSAQRLRPVEEGLALLALEQEGADLERRAEPDRFGR